MRQIKLALVALLLGGLPAEAQVLHFSCKGEMRSNKKNVATPAEESVTIDLRTGVVTFRYLTARITKAGPEFVRFKGDDIPEGTIDRVTGKLWVKEEYPGAKSYLWFDWHLTCRIIRPLF
jgi:hypothetical protein